MQGVGHNKFPLNLRRVVPQESENAMMLRNRSIIHVEAQRRTATMNNTDSLVLDPTDNDSVGQDFGQHVRWEIKDDVLVPTIMWDDEDVQHIEDYGDAESTGYTWGHKTPTCDDETTRMISKTATEKKQMQQTTQSSGLVGRVRGIEYYLFREGVKVDDTATHHFLKSITHYMESQGVFCKQNSRRFRQNFIKWCRALTVDTAVVTLFDTLGVPFTVPNFHKIIPHLCCTMRTCIQVYSYAAESDLGIHVQFYLLHRALVQEQRVAFHHGYAGDRNPLRIVRKLRTLRWHLNIKVQPQMLSQFPFAADLSTEEFCRAFRPRMSLNPRLFALLVGSLVEHQPFGGSMAEQSHFDDMAARVPRVLRLSVEGGSSVQWLYPLNHHAHLDASTLCAGMSRFGVEVLSLGEWQGDVVRLAARYAYTHILVQVTHPGNK